MEMVTRNCEECEKEFQTRARHTETGRGKYCSRSCAAIGSARKKGFNIGRTQLERSRIRRETHPNLKEYMRAMYLKHSYGLSLDEYVAMVKASKGKCAICLKDFSSTKDMHVDHDHINNKVRGLICADCNHALGYAHDSIEVLEACIAYLKKHSESET